jgi:beta-1,4-mannosyltransferase
MRVLVVSPFGTRVNPYIGLFAGGLRTAGANVDVTRVLDLSSLVSAARPDVIHFHWIERYDPPPVLQPRSHLGPVASVERVVLRPANAGALYSLRHWQRLSALLDGLAAFRREGGRVAYTVHNLDPHEAGSWAECRALKEIIRAADALHVHDTSTADEIALRFGRRDRITVIPHGHYLDAYPNAVSQAEARVRLGLPANGFVFACLGLMRPYKGLEELLPAFRAAFAGDGRPSGGVRLMVAGRPADAAYVSRLRDLAGGDPRIILDPHFIPEDEVQVYLNAASVAVLPYRQITTSGAALLAISFGLRVVAPAIGAFPHLVTPDRGVLYAPGRLADALEQAREKDWSGAREQILDWVRQFDWGETGRRLLEAYRS